MSLLPSRQIRRLLVANRGEIAIRVLSAARELDPSIETIAIYTDNDPNHTFLANEAIKLPSPAHFMDIPYLIELVKKNDIDSIHPGYGFLSESAEFAHRMWLEAECVVIGPGWDILDALGDKLESKELARRCEVPILPAVGPTSDVKVLEDFAGEVGYPIMIKALDGGGGRGIRLVHEKAKLADALKRAIGESPSGQVFAEKAAINGYRHVEVQIIGDGKGNVRHLWERECSIQRRFQKIVEFAPSSITNRQLVAEVIAAAVKMAKSVNYLSLGTFEFLVAQPEESAESNNRHNFPGENTGDEFYFLECNPRLQVEHTITECITGVDLVRAQLQIAQGHTLSQAEIPLLPEDSIPDTAAIQMRVTAEDASKNFALSIGRITEFHAPGGNGVRVDTHIHGVQPTIVGTDFDSMLAKIIVYGSHNSVLDRATRAIEETVIGGVQTNLKLLATIIKSQDFKFGLCDTQWLEKHIDRLVKESESTVQPEQSDAASTQSDSSDSSSSGSSSSGSSSGSEDEPSKRETASPNDPQKITLPFSGTLLEILVEPGQIIKKDEPVAVIRQMKVELEVRSPYGGVITWVIDAEEGEQLVEGTLLCELGDQSKL